MDRVPTKTDFLLFYEPSKAEVEKFPFLDGLGGVCRDGRNAYFIHVCDTYNSLRAIRDEITEIKKELQELHDRQEDDDELRDTGIIDRSVFISKEDDIMQKEHQLSKYVEKAKKGLTFLVNIPPKSVGFGTEFF